MYFVIESLITVLRKSNIWRKNKRRSPKFNAVVHANQFQVVKNQARTRGFDISMVVCVCGGWKSSSYF